MHGEPSTPTVRDRRTFPMGLLSPRVQMWTVLGFAVLILFAIIASSVSRPVGTVPMPSSGVPLALNPEQKETLQDRLIQGLKRGRESVTPIQPPISPSVVQPRPLTSGGPVAAAPAASVGREPQNDQTLFASNVVVSRRTGPDAVLTPVPRPSPSSVEPGERPTADPAIPSLDDVTRSVMRALPPPAPPAAVADAAPRAVPPSPVNGHRVSEGTVFDAVLVNRLEGSFAGPVNALITAPVYAQDLTLVIPAGARVLGTSVRVQELDAARLAVAFHRVLLPDGRDVSLDTFVGTNVQGTPGLSGHVNRHYVSTFGAAAAVGLITGLAQWVGSGFGTADATVVIAGGIGDSTSQAASQTMARFLNRLPTVTVREGSRLKIYVTSDLTLPRYEGGAK